MSCSFLNKLVLVGMLLSSSLSAAALSDGMQQGKAYYFNGEFKKAIVHFQRTAQSRPQDPEPYFWLGKSYAVLADINAPVMGARARMHARQHLSKAVQLAPNSAEYRHELFHFLVGSEDSWSALREAEALLARMPASEVEELELYHQLQHKRQDRCSPEAITGKLLVWGPETLARGF